MGLRVSTTVMPTLYWPEDRDEVTPDAGETPLGEATQTNQPPNTHDNSPQETSEDGE